MTRTLTTGRVDATLRSRADGSTAQFYVNGAPASSGSADGTTITVPQRPPADRRRRNLRAALHHGQHRRGARGYNSALSATQVLADMNTAIGGGGPPPDTQPPTTPTNLVATAVSQTQINLGSGTPGIDGPLGGAAVPRGALPAGGLHRLYRDRGPTPTNSFNNTGLQPGSTYRYRVRAQDGAPTPNLSGYSNIAHGDDAGRPQHSADGDDLDTCERNALERRRHDQLLGWSDGHRGRGNAACIVAQLDARAAALLAVRTDELSPAHHPVLGGSRRAARKAHPITSTPHTSSSRSPRPIPADSPIPRPCDSTR